MRIAIILFCIIVIIAGVWIGWKFQPWMPAGEAVHVSSERLGDYDFEVWQRKANLPTEPFATGLFARKEGGPWKTFLLDVEDTYHPPIVLRKKGSAVEVFRGSTRLGVFDQTQQIFRWDSDGALLSGDSLDSDPPGSWWVKQPVTPGRDK